MDWYNCYKDRWGDLLVPESFRHPAKVSPGLSKKIYSHMLEMKWIKAGDTVIDPFAGVGGLALHAILNSINFVGIELEEKYFELGNENISSWIKRYNSNNHSKIIRGDSRNLSQIIKNNASVSISSPPYADIEQSGGQNGLRKYGTGLTQGSNFFSEYGINPNNLGRLKSTEEGFQAAISSPPYAETRVTGNGDEGTSQARMPDGSYPRGKEGWKLRKSLGARYGESEEQLATMSETDFWSASKRVVQEIYKSLTKNGHSIWIVKSFIKDRKVVDFPEQWKQLCLSCGFDLIHEHKAWMIEKKGTQKTFSGNTEDVIIQRKSFFRILNETHKGLPKIDYEIILCMEKK